jgi:ABC-2 type transport system ATP-binding protein
LGEPKYLMLDEPANGLDPEGIAWLRDFLKDYADKGNAVFVSSHLLSEMSQMADNVVVIGKGKLIADTSIKRLLSGSAHTGVFVRSSSNSKLESVLGKAKLSFTKDADGLKVTGASTDKVGKLAFDGGITVLELSRHDASLEDAFLELTADAEEYTTGAKK